MVMNKGSAFISIQVVLENFREEMGKEMSRICFKIPQQTNIKEKQENR